MINEEEFRELKHQVDESKSEYERAQGALQELRNRLRKEFSCSTVEQAKQKLENWEEEMVTLEKDFKKHMAAYQKKWHEKES